MSSLLQLQSASGRFSSICSYAKLGRKTPTSILASQSKGLTLFAQDKQTFLIPFRPVYSVRHRQLQSSDKSTLNRHNVRPIAITTQGTFAPSKFNTATNLVSGGSSNPSQLNSSRSSANPTSVFDEPLSEHLPSLPVPSLEETLERLKETIWPIAMNSSEFASTLELIERFSQTAGPKLDLLLKAKASQTKNWMTHDWWTQEAYLKSRAPLVINSNPAMVFPNLPYEVANQRQLICTVGQLISGLIDFKLALHAGYNPEATNASSEYQLEANVCYSQYKHIFGTTRIPGEQMDELKHADHHEAERDFKFVLAFKNEFYEVSLAHEANEDEQTRLDTLISLLNKLFDLSQDSALQQASSSDGDCSEPLGAGLLTTCARSQWARSRVQLLTSETLEAIERAQFLVCLDSIPQSTSTSSSSSNSQESSLATFNRLNESSFIDQLNGSPLGSGQHYEALLRQVLHADRTNAGQRWFDKSLQLIIVSDQANERYLGAGINYEHSLAEGGVVSKMIEYTYDRLLTNHRQRQQAGQSQETENNAKSSLRPLKMFDDKHNLEVEETLKQAQRDYLAHVDQFDLAYFEFKQYGSNSIKSWRFSPDSWFQVALQLAHFQLHKRLGPCYESASTRAFAFGRTETIRSLTKDVAEFCHQPEYSTLQAAIQSHKNYANAANNALAIDRVLMGYRLVFNELKSGCWSWGVPTFSSSKNHHLAYRHNNDQQQRADLNDLFDERELELLASFFNNELIERSKKFSLSTSQVASIHPQICMSYGPYLADGYGCCYNITGQQIVASITGNSANSSFSCEVDKYSESLHESLERMRTLVEDQQQRRTH